MREGVEREGWEEICSMGNLHRLGGLWRRVERRKGGEGVWERWRSHCCVLVQLGHDSKDSPGLGGHRVEMASPLFLLQGGSPDLAPNPTAFSTPCLSPKETATQTNIHPLHVWQTRGQPRGQSALLTQLATTAPQRFTTHFCLPLRHFTLHRRLYIHFNLYQGHLFVYCYTASPLSFALVWSLWDFCFVVKLKDCVDEVMSCCEDQLCICCDSVPHSLRHCYGHTGDISACHLHFSYNQTVNKGTDLVPPRSSKDKSVCHQTKCFCSFVQHFYFKS